MTREANAIDVHVGKRIRLRRTALGLSIADLARKVGVPPEDLAACERGARRAGAALLLPLARALGVPTGYFFRDPDPGEPGTAFFADADDGIRLLRAFSQIRDPAMRDLIIRLATIMSRVEAPDSQTH